MLVTAPMRALAQRIYFHRRGDEGQSFEEWSRALARNDMEPIKPIRDLELRCI